MKDLTNKKILFIICGGVSAYKSLETIRLFKKNNAEMDMGTFKYVKQGVRSGSEDKAGMIFDDGFKKQYIENYMEESVVHQNVFDEEQIKINTCRL